MQLPRRARRVHIALAGALGLAVAAAAAQACGLDVSGVLEPGPDASENVGASLPEGAPPTDGGPVAPRCEASAECTKPPDGWTFVLALAHDGGAAASCPSELGEARVLFEGPRSVRPTCDCQCGDAGTANPCYSPAALSFRADSVGVPGGCDAATGNFLPTGACQTPVVVPITMAGLMADARAPSLACPGTATPPPITGDAAIAACTLVSAAPCVAGEICIQGRGDICVTRAGEHDCPEGYGTRRVVAPEDGIADTRKCGACTCKTAATVCANATLTFYSNTTCDAGARVVPINGTCAALPAGPSPESYRYQATPNAGGCVPPDAGPPVTGELSVDAGVAVTLCCAP